MRWNFIWEFFLISHLKSQKLFNHLFSSKCLNFQKKLKIKLILVFACRWRRKFKIWAFFLIFRLGSSLKTHKTKRKFLTVKKIVKNSLFEIQRTSHENYDERVIWSKWEQKKLFPYLYEKLQKSFAFLYTYVVNCNFMKAKRKLK